MEGAARGSQFGDALFSGGPSAEGRELFLGGDGGPGKGCGRAAVLAAPAVASGTIIAVLDELVSSDITAGLICNCCHGTCFQSMRSWCCS